MILLAAEELAVAPQSVLFIGDSKFDMMAARAAGCVAVHLDETGSGQAVECDVRCRTLAT